MHIRCDLLWAEPIDTRCSTLSFAGHAATVDEQIGFRRKMDPEQAGTKQTSLHPIELLVVITIIALMFALVLMHDPVWIGEPINENLLR